MGDILDKYMASLKKQQSSDEELPNDFMGEKYSDEQMEEYKQEVDRLRNDPTDMKNAYEAAMKKIIKFDEKQMEEDNLITKEEVTSIKVLHAYCDNCGSELISQGPPMFNPFTMERTCIHSCAKCGRKFNLEYAYPRIAYYNNENELMAYGQ